MELSVTVELELDGGFVLQRSQGQTHYRKITVTVYAFKAHDTRSRNRRHKSTPFSGAGNRHRFSAPIFRSVYVRNENFWRRK